jgi:hypothetical protein
MRHEHAPDDDWCEDCFGEGEDFGGSLADAALDALETGVPVTNDNELTQKSIDTSELYIIDKVSECYYQPEAGAYYEFTLRDLHQAPGTGCSGFVSEKSKFSVAPQAGDKIRLYGGIGRPIRGIDINDVEMYYETWESYRARAVAEQAIKDAAEAAKYASEGWEANNARIALLPRPFQLRIAGFRERNAQGQWFKNEAYELFVCEQAVAIAAHVKVEDMKAFHDAEFEKQKEMVPELADSHSGNTFGAACRLALVYISDPADSEKVIEHLHGALCPLLGCQNYGCWSTTHSQATA